MRRLQDSVDIDAAPDQIWEWLNHLAERYTDWHPDHVSARWRRGRPNAVGSVFEAVEILAGHRERLRFEVTAVEPPRRFAYRLRGPISLMLPRGEFAIAPEDGGSRFTATIDVRFGAVVETIFGPRAAALRRHMREEGENLKCIIEGRTA